MGVTEAPRPGDTAPASLGLRPPLRAWCRGSEDMDMEVMEGAEARRLGSLQTEVGGATSAMSGIRAERGWGVRTLDTLGSRMVVSKLLSHDNMRVCCLLCFLSQTRVTGHACHVTPRLLAQRAGGFLTSWDHILTRHHTWPSLASRLTSHSLRRSVSASRDGESVMSADLWPQGLTSVKWDIICDSELTGIRRAGSEETGSESGHPGSGGTAWADQRATRDCLPWAGLARDYWTLRVAGHGCRLAAHEVSWPRWPGSARLPGPDQRATGSRGHEPTSAGSVGPVRGHCRGLSLVATLAARRERGRRGDTDSTEDRTGITAMSPQRLPPTSARWRRPGELCSLLSPVSRGRAPWPSLARPRSQASQCPGLMGPGPGPDGVIIVIMRHPLYSSLTLSHSQQWSPGPEIRGQLGPAPGPLLGNPFIRGHGVKRIFYKHFPHGHWARYPQYSCLSKISLQSPWDEKVLWVQLTECVREPWTAPRSLLSGEWRKEPMRG